MSLRATADEERLWRRTRLFQHDMITIMCQLHSYIFFSRDEYNLSLTVWFTSK